MKIKQFDKLAKLPIKSHLPDCGLDMFMPSTVIIESFATKTIPLGFGFAIPEGHAGMLVPRSSIAQRGLIIQTSIIDPGYTGQIHLIVTNCSKESTILEKESRVCSLVAYSVLNPYIEIVEEFEESERGCKGLGSTGQ